MPKYNTQQIVYAALLDGVKRGAVEKIFQEVSTGIYYYRLSWLSEVIPEYNIFSNYAEAKDLCNHPW